MKETLVVSDKGKVTLPEWAWRGLLKMSGSKAKSDSGVRRAVKRQFTKLLKDYADSLK